MTRKYMGPNSLSGLSTLVKDDIDQNGSGGGNAAVQGPPGPQGEQGIPGKDGADGLDGLSAYELAVEQGYKGSLDEWLASLKGEQGIQGETGEQGIQGVAGKDGSDGLSAYEIAVQNGFTGTEKEWLDSLHGKDISAIPIGGTTDQVLAKASDKDFDVTWVTINPIPSSTIQQIIGGTYGLRIHERR